MSLQSRGEEEHVEYSKEIAWVPDHAGIDGNNQADELAKAGCRLPYFTPPGIVPTDAKIALKPIALSMLQSEWTTSCSESGIALHLREIRVEIEKWP